MTAGLIALPREVVHPAAGSALAGEERATTAREREILAKLRARSRAEAVTLGVRRDLITL